LSELALFGAQTLRCPPICCLFHQLQDERLAFALDQEGFRLTDISAQHATIRDKAIAYIKKHWGTLDDLPAVFIPVVWVTVFRALEIGSQVESPQTLVKDMCLNKGQLTFEVQMATGKLQFLQKIIPQLRALEDYEQRLADCYLFIDILRWNIHDAADRGRFSRTWKRVNAKDDPLYRYPVPLEIWNRA
jgi:hypothetical protein